MYLQTNCWHISPHSLLSKQKDKKTKTKENLTYLFLLRSSHSNSC